MLTALRPAPFKPSKNVEIKWSTWRKGLNTLLREGEIDGSELAQATNLLLTGSGVPSKRWGSANFYLSSPTTGGGRGILPIKDVDGSQQLLSMTDWGVLVKQSSASYTPITGASWASGYNMEGTQLGGKVYLVNGQRELVRYNFSTLQGFPTLSVPTGITATNLSGASGAVEWAWRVAAVSNVGETIGSTRISLASLPQDLRKTTVRVNWTAVSAASGDITGYNVYRGAAGDEAFIGGVDNTTLQFDDVGNPPIDDTKTTPASDTTGGPVAKYIIRYKDRMVMAGVPGAPSKLIVSGRYPYHERFDLYNGGAYVSIEPDAGDDITGISTYDNPNSGGTQTIIVFKENSVWEVTVGAIIAGDVALTDLQYRLLSRSQGCSSHRSIVAVENDIMFANSRGIYILRHEPQLLNVINASEMSAKIRPFFEGLTHADLNSSAGFYADKKYVLSFPISKKTIVFDRERLSFMGPWTTTFGINGWARFVDANGIERWVCTDSGDNYISEFRKSYTDDKGSAFTTLFRTKKEDFKDPFIFKTITEIYTLFRNVVGSVQANIYLEERSGATLTATSFSITSSTGVSGIGTDLWGLAKFGWSNTNPQSRSEESPKKTTIYKTARTVQIEVKTTGNSDNYELLSILISGILQNRGNSPQSWTT